ATALGRDLVHVLDTVPLGPRVGGDDAATLVDSEELELLADEVSGLHAAAISQGDQGSRLQALSHSVRGCGEGAGTVHDRLKEPVLVFGEPADVQDVVKVGPRVPGVLGSLSWVPAILRAAAASQQGEGRGIPKRSGCAPTPGRSR